MLNIRKQLISAGMGLLYFTISAAQPTVLTIDVNRVKGEVNPNMWGLFFEDIDMGADGGIYAELAKNRSFEFFCPLDEMANVGQGEGRLPAGSQPAGATGSQPTLPAGQYRKSGQRPHGIEQRWLPRDSYASQSAPEYLVLEAAPYSFNVFKIKLP